MMSKEKRRVPKLRFPGFTEDWEQRKFKDLFKERREKTIKENEETLLSCAITGIYLNSELFSHFRGSSTIGYLKIKKYDLILSAQNLHLGNANINLFFEKGMISPAYKVFELKSIDPYFVNAWVKQDATKNFFLKATTEGASQCRKNIEWDVLLNQEITVPNNLEQITIGKFINKFDRIITLHQRKLEHLNLKKKALLQKLFPKNGERYPELRFPGFTDAWEQRKLGDIATFSKGNGYSKSDLASSGDPIILYGRLYTNYETTISNVDTFVELKDKSVISQGGEVIVPASGETAEDISRASVVKNQGIIIGGDLNVIKANHLLDPTFLALTISNGGQQKELSKRAQGKSVVHLHNSDLQEVNLIFPLLNEQKEISTLFEKMDNIITLHQRKLDHLQLQKKALLQQMFV